MVCSREKRALYSFSGETASSRPQTRGCRYHWGNNGQHWLVPCYVPGTILQALGVCGWVPFAKAQDRRVRRGKLGDWFPCSAHPYFGRSCLPLSRSASPRATVLLGFEKTLPLFAPPGPECYPLGAFLFPVGSLTLPSLCKLVFSLNSPPLLLWILHLPLSDSLAGTRYMNSVSDAADPRLRGSPSQVHRGNWCWQGGAGPL